MCTDCGLQGCLEIWKLCRNPAILFAACFPSWLRGMVRSQCFVASLAPCQQLNTGTVFHRSHTARVTRLVNLPKVTLMIVRPVKKGMQPGFRTNEGDNDSVKTELVLGVLPGPKGHFWRIMFSTGILQKEQKELCCC